MKKLLINSPIPAANGCLLWAGCCDHSGYGRIRINKRDFKAHRIIWESINGKIPSGLLVLHKCDVRSCINPTHLFLGTHFDNARDRVNKNRSRPRKGEQHGEAKLTNSDVAAIRSDTRSQASIAKAYGMSDSQISNIKRYRHWRHI